ncbi:putative membrane protein [Winogradskyella psychrotolerans RS-3]|uniref:Putative membrane protein n=1 Tax=Winogradskyella psychrotolerans RS-3 TaxID=641526 RepID=S7XBA2_9FLAO|nr:putative membrane protein [Winogradskyella psychrotolerans RS-3]
MVLLGVIFFSGSIYGLATNSLSGFDFKSIALMTPVGGLLLIMSWVIMLIGIIKNKMD